MTKVTARYWTDLDGEVEYFADRKEAMVFALDRAKSTGRPCLIGTGWKHDATVFPLQVGSIDSDKGE